MFKWLGIGAAAVVAAALIGVAFGAVNLEPLQVAKELLGLDNDLTEREAAIVWQLRLPRVVLGLLVGSVLGLAGGAYQGVFRNPLAEPYFLGVAAGAGVGATIAIVARRKVIGELPFSVPAAAFVGALLAIALTYLVGTAGDRYRSTATLILAGVAVASFFTALQTFILQQNVDSIREVYDWILGSLATSGWHEVLVLLPYAIIVAIVIIAHARALDVLSVGDEEAASLGAHPRRTRLILLATASLATAAAVAVSGLIGFVGIIIPHAVRLLAGTSYRVILPVSALFGGAFLVLTDLLARTVASPGELPIGVLTAFFGAPFFILVLRTSRRAAL